MTYRDKAHILAEALPYIRRFNNKTIVIKFGGKAMEDEAAEQAFVEDVVLLFFVGIKPVIVHGGGKEVSAFSSRLGIKPQFVRGLRVSDKETTQIAEMVLSGAINKRLVSAINRNGGKAVGLSGKDANLLMVAPLKKETYQYVGRVKMVNTDVLKDLASAGYIPVVSSMGVDKNGETYNVNADEVAAAVAVALKASKCIFLTNVDGVYKSEKEIYSRMNEKEVKRYLRGNLATEGMIPKLKAALDVVSRGKGEVHILNALMPHVLLMELFTEKGVGTMITK